LVSFTGGVGVVLIGAPVLVVQGCLGCLEELKSRA